jgi:hypothetical protein
MNVPDFIGWCTYCKEEVYDSQDYVKNKGKLFHNDCYDLMKDEINDE